MRNPGDWIVVGCFGRPQGLKGLIRVVSFTEPKDAILSYAPWFRHHQDQWVPIERNHSTVQNGIVLVTVDGYEQREQLATLTHTEIAVTRAQLPVLAEGDYYWQDMLHMQVFTQSGKLLGKVTEILPTGSNDVLVVCGEKRHLIPYIKGVYIVSVDTLKRCLLVDWDEDF